MIATNRGNLVSRLRLAMLLGVLLVVAACGGGGGGSGGGEAPPPSTSPPPPPPPPPPSGPSAEDLTNAQNAKLQMTQEPDWLTISWRDTFDREQGYRVERRVGTDSWTELGALPAIDGGSVTWERRLVSSDSGTYRVVALFDGYSLPLHAAPGESEVAIDMTAPASIEFGYPQPLDAPVQVSVTNAAPALSVTYRLNDVTVARATNGDDFAATIPTERLARTDDYESWVAEIHKSAGLTLLTQRYRTARNTLPAILLQVAPTRTGDDSLQLTAIASSAAGIVSVEFFANDTPLQTVRSPDRWQKWVHSIAAGTVPSGMNTFRAVATDYSGATVSMDVEYTRDILPSLSVAGPFDGMIATNGTLNISGTFADDIDGAVLSASLFDARSALPQRTTTILRTRSSPFSIDYPVEALSGERVLAVRVETPDGRVNVRSYNVILPATARAYELIGTDASHLLAAEDGVLLYRNNSGAVVLRNAAGEETDLQVPPGLHFTKWWLAAGHVVAQQRGSLRLHTFTGPGTTLDISAPVGEPYPFGVEPVVRDRWVSWWSNDGNVNVYNLDTGTLTHINFALFANGPVDYQYDLDTTPGNERLVFFTIDEPSLPGIYSYQLATGVTERLAWAFCNEVRTDGTRLAWQEGPDLKTAPLNDLSAVTFLTRDYGGKFFVEEGLVGWWGRNPNVGIDDGTTTTALVQEIGGGFEQEAFEDGHFIFSDAGSLFSWNRTSGTHHLLDTVRPTLHTQGVAYLLTGDTGAMYRTTLP